MIQLFKSYALLAVLLSVSLMEACHTGSNNENNKTDAEKALELRKQIDTIEAPVLSPE